MIPLIIVKTVKGFAYIRPERVVAINASDADDCLILMTDGVTIAAAEPAEDVVARLETEAGEEEHALEAIKERNAHWPMSQTEIETMIRDAFPDARVEVEGIWAGDGNHYVATVVTPAFKGKTRVRQHQMVYEALKGRMGGELHALALTTSES